MESVNRIRANNIHITNGPIIYYWWFKKSVLDTLLRTNRLEFDESRVKKLDFENDVYVLLYIGKGKNGNARLVNYHILDQDNYHRLKYVQNGRLSSLRQTLCGLLGMNMSESKEAINEFMDKNCLVDWEEVSQEELNEKEKKKIGDNYLPLNHHHQTNNFSTEYRQNRTRLKTQYRL